MRRWNEAGVGGDGPGPTNSRLSPWARPLQSTLAMHNSSSTRRKAAFVPWLAALVIGATAHAGWLIHELDSHEGEGGSGDRAAAPTLAIDVDVNVEIDPALLDDELGDDRERASKRRLAKLMRARERARAREGRRAAVPSCRHAPALAPGGELEPADDLDLWIHEVDRYTYTIDRRVFDEVATADFDLPELGQLGVLMRGLGLTEPVELRNIRAGTPLYLLGLRTGDRVLAIATENGEGTLERVQVAIERRGRPISLVYDLV